MGQLLAFLFLFCFLSYTPVYAVTIVDVEEISRIVEIDYINDCEWWETIETQTTTTYREPVVPDPGPTLGSIIDPGIVLPTFYSGDNSLLGNGQPGTRSPCFPDPEDKEAIIPEYCNAEPQVLTTGSAGFLSANGGPVVGESGLPLTFREWSEVVFSYTRVHHDTCHTCFDPVENPISTPTPEPQSWVLGLTGLVGILLFRRKK